MENITQYVQGRFGYKGTDKNMKCRDFQYEIGKWYTHIGKIEPCESGFHLCEEFSHVFNYYDPYHHGRYFIVEYGEKYIRKEDKIVTDKIRLIREIHHELITEEDEVIARKEKNSIQFVEKVGFYSGLIIKMKNTNYVSDCLLYYVLSNYGTDCSLDIVQYLLDCGADVNTSSGFEALARCINSCLPAVKIMNKCMLKGGYDYLLLKASTTNLETVKYLIEKHVQFENEKQRKYLLDKCIDIAEQWGRVSIGAFLVCYKLTPIVQPEVAL